MDAMQCVSTPPVDSAPSNRWVGDVFLESTFIQTHIATTMPNSSAGGSAVYVVDRIEGTIAVLVEDSPASDSVEVEARKLPKGCAEEGAVLRVPVAPGSAPQWAKALRDRKEERQRADEVGGRLKRLQDKDAGGDVTL